MGSVVAVSGLSHSTVCGILVTQPEMEPISLALQGGFLTTGTPGKSQDGAFFFFFFFNIPVYFVLILQESVARASAVSSCSKWDLLRKR